MKRVLLVFMLMVFSMVLVEAHTHYGPDPPGTEIISELEISNDLVIADSALFIFKYRGDACLGPGDISSNMQVILIKLFPHYRLYNINYLRPIIPDTRHYAQLGYGL